MLLEMGDISVHEKAALYDSVLSQILDIHAPVVCKEIKIKRGSPWYNKDLKSLKKKKRQAEDKW